LGKDLLFSIIIPIYNVERYLLQCLESVLNQTYTNIEVILVNDGSTDNSGAICEEIKVNDSRVKVIHTDNKGVSFARNLGINIATGDYILFVDSDDWLEKDAIEKISKVLNKRLYDLVFFNLVKEIDNKLIPVYPFQDSRSLISKNELENMLPQLIKQEVINSPIKIYKTDVIKNNNIKFNTGISIAEDYLFNIECFLNADSLFIMKDILYHYMIRNNNSLTRKFKENKYEQLMYVNNTIMELVTKHGKYNSEKLVEALLYIRLKNVYSCFTDLFNRECNFSYKKKLEFITNVTRLENDKDYLKINNWRFKILALFLKNNSNKIIYGVSRLLNFYKNRYSFKL